VMAVHLASLDEVGLDRSGRRSGPEESNAYSAVPGLTTKAELSRAVPYRVPLVVIGLDGRPVIAPGEPGIGRSTKAPRVVADRRLGKAELGRDFGDAHSTLELLGHKLPHDPGSVLRPWASVVGFRSHGLCSEPALRGRLTARRQSLELVIGVRVPAPQPLLVGEPYRRSRTQKWPIYRTFTLLRKAVTPDAQSLSHTARR
jgi:hypothetical protein